MLKKAIIYTKSKQNLMKSNVSLPDAQHLQRTIYNMVVRSNI